METVKLVVFVPTTHADQVRAVLGDHGAGEIGNYGHCSFSLTGFGRYRPLDGAKPAIGTVGELETVEEERIEVVCQKDKLTDLLREVKKVHPYEEVAFDVYPLLTI